MELVETNENLPGAVGKTFLWMTLSGSVSIANSVLIWVVLARMRGVDEVGQFAAVMGLYSLFYGTVSLGLMPYLINEIAARNTGALKLSLRDLLGSASVLMGLSGFVSSVLMTAATLVLSNSHEERLAAALLSLAMIPTPLIVVADSASIAFGRARLVAVITTAENVLRTLVPIWLIWSGYGIVAVCSSFAALRFLALAINGIVYRSSLTQFVFSRMEFRALARVFPTFAATITLSSLNWQVPLIVLGYVSSGVETASFGVASRFLIPVTILMGAYANAIQPSLGERFHRAPHEFTTYLAKVSGYPLLLAGLAAISSIFFSGLVLGKLFGANYESAAPVLEILAISTVPFCLVMTVARGLVAANSQKIDLLANGVGVGVCICAVSFLVPGYGARGAALALLLSFGAMALIETVYFGSKIAVVGSWRLSSTRSAAVTDS
jgi:O-antigen/teichoic acid export membrane protein